jgi:hypothetical protein
MVVQIANLMRLWDFYSLWQKAKPGRPAPAGRTAHVAQLVEHVLGKDEVTGSIPVMGSRMGSGPAVNNSEKSRQFN